MPSIEQLQNPKLSQASTIYSADGVEMGKFFTENRQPVDSAAISPWVFKALIATEDKRFNEHSGIDLRRMAGVVAGILTGNSDAGGGSTISQQLAKNLYPRRTYRIATMLINKIREMIIARRMEGRTPVGLALAVPDHPWTKATRDAAATANWAVTAQICSAQI